MLHHPVTMLHHSVTMLHHPVTMLHNSVTTLHHSYTMLHHSVTMLHHSVTMLHHPVTILHPLATMLHKAWSICGVILLLLPRWEWQGSITCLYAPLYDTGKRCCLQSIELFTGIEIQMISLQSLRRNVMHSVKSVMVFFYSVKTLSKLTGFGETVKRK